MGIEPTSSAWKADILADVLYPQLQNSLYHNFAQMSSMNLGGTASGGSPPQALTRQIPPFVTCGDIFPRSGGSLSSRGRLWAMPQSLSPPRKAVPLDRLSPAGERCRVSDRVGNGWIAAQRQDGRGKAKSTTHFCAVLFFLVEITGIEPVTSCMPCKRSPS